MKVLVHFHSLCNKEALCYLRCLFFYFTSIWNREVLPVLKIVYCAFCSYDFFFIFPNQMYHWHNKYQIHIIKFTRGQRSCVICMQQQWCQPLSWGRDLAHYDSNFDIICYSASLQSCNNAWASWTCNTVQRWNCCGSF